MVRPSALLLALWLVSGCAEDRPAEQPQTDEAAPAVVAAPPAAPPPEPEPPPDLPPLSERLVLTLEVEVQPSGRALLRGETNLPDGVTLMTSVGEVAEGSDRITGFYGQDRAFVSRGRFTAGPFGPGGAGLSAGRYEASATMPYPRTQSAAVQAVVGSKGENLRGPLVERGEMGATASVDVVFTVGSQAQRGAADEAREAAVASAAQAIRQLRQLVEQGRAMESLRTGTSTAAARQCGDRMRELQRQAEQIRDRANDYPPLLRASVGAAAIQAGLCVSCSGSALDYCRATAEMIDDAEVDLRDAGGSSR